MSPSIASHVFLSLLIALFNSTRSLFFKGFMLIKPIVYPSLIESNTGLISEKSFITNGLTIIFGFLPSSLVSPRTSSSTYSSPTSSTSGSLATPKDLFILSINAFTILPASNNHQVFFTQLHLYNYVFYLFFYLFIYYWFCFI